MEQGSPPLVPFGDMAVWRSPVFWYFGNVSLDQVEDGCKNQVGLVAMSLLTLDLVCFSPARSLFWPANFLWPYLLTVIRA
jgi:hypothetical protein